MADKFVRFSNEKFGDFITRMRAENVEFIEQFRKYRNFAYLCKREPTKYRMRWFAGYVVYEMLMESGTWSEDWSISSKTSVLDYILEDKDKNENSVVGELV